MAIKNMIKNRKAKLLLCSLAVILIFAIGITVAYIHISTDSLENTFNPAVVNCEVDEVFEGDFSEKSNVKIKNTGNTTAYLRATVLANWMREGTEQGVEHDEFMPVTPKRDVDYTIEYNTDVRWIQGADGFWYYTEPVAAGEYTEVLINKIKALKVDNGDGFELTAEIVCTAIQASPADAVKEAWGSAVTNVDDNGNLIVIPYNKGNGE